jgi:GT2 family glycosyltransferase
MPDLSVVIVNWNTRDLLRQCLCSIFTPHQNTTYEVFVVDNGSTDDSVEMVRQEFPTVHLIRNSENLGYSTANNQAIKHTIGRYVLLLNSDTKVPEKAFQQMVIFMDTHPEAGILGTKLLNPDGSRQYSCDCFPRTPWQLFHEKILDLCIPGNHTTRQGKMRRWDYDSHFPVDYVIGAVLMIRRETLEQIGLLDEDFFMYAEDIDWCYRAVKSGWHAYYVGEIGVYHYNRGSSEKTPEHAHRLRQLRVSSLLHFYSKHYGHLAARLLQSMMSIKTYIRS